MKAKPVRQIKDGITVRVWRSVYSAATYLGYDCSSISKCARGQIKSYKGYSWVYCNESDIGFEAVPFESYTNNIESYTNNT
jgi:hypothetical protein